MEVTVISDVRYEPNVEALSRRLHVGGAADELAALLEEAARVARPRAMFGAAYIDEKGDDYVVIEGVRFDSRVLRVNLEQAHRVFPFVATAGHEMQEWADSLTDVLHRFWADAIYESALAPAIHALDAIIDERYSPGHTSRMNPGSLADWPLAQQGPLFRLMGDVRAALGVELTDSYLMVPRKSVSGIRFPTEASFESCQLCPRDVCPGRRAPYEPDLYANRYQH